MAKTKVLITVTTYPLPSRSYDELVCTAGVLEDGRWIRIYPVPFRFLNFKKYQWVELELQEPRKPDFRPESYSPVNVDLSDLKIINWLDTRNNWAERKNYCLTNVYTNLEKLITDSQNPLNVSLATFKPAKIIDFIIEDDERDWKPGWIAQLKQIDMFTTRRDKSRRPFRKVPYKFKYHFIDDIGKKSKLMIEDWEIGALYWNCLKSAEGDEEVAKRKVKEKYFDTFVNNRDLYLFLGTTLKAHQRRWSNPFVIAGVFYPKKSSQIGIKL